MENQEVTQNQVEDNSNWSFVSDEEASNALSDEQQPTSSPQPEREPEPQEPVQQPSNPETSGFDAVMGEEETYEQDYQTQGSDQGFSEEEIEYAVQQYVSDRLGVDIESLEDLRSMSGGNEMDERIQAIADFVAETGRDPGDWFAYQSLNPDNMDDVTAIQVQMATDYPNLSHEEITTLIQNKYKLDENIHTEEEVRLSKLQMKIDAENARDLVAEYRERYAAPEFEDQDEFAVSEEDVQMWLEDVYQNVDDLQGVEFDLGNGNSFRFGLSNQYKSSLASRNEQIEDYFDQYVLNDGSFDHDSFNIHRSVIDNIDTIIQSIYKQGLADGQRGLVNQAANINVNTPRQGAAPQEDTLSAQLREAMGGGSTWSF